MSQRRPTRQRQRRRVLRGNPLKTFVDFQLWNSEQCEAARSIAQKTTSHEATVVGGNVGIRSTTRRQLNYYPDSHQHEELLTACRLHNSWGFNTFNGESGLPSIDVVHYGPEDFYKSHTDWGNKHQNRKISFTVQLSKPDEYEGGEVWLYDGPEAWSVNRTQGWMTIWPSWTLHSVDPVISGNRWSVVGWVLGPPFI